MTWFRVDDGLHSHPKVLALFDGGCAGEALGLWLLAGSWCSAQLTDGRVPASAVRRLGFGLSAAHELVRVGLWTQAEDGAFVFHDWTSCNPSRVDVETARAKTREKVRRSRERARDARESVCASDGLSGSSLAAAQPSEEVWPPPGRGEAAPGDPPPRARNPVTSEPPGTRVTTPARDPVTTRPVPHPPTRPDPIPRERAGRARAREASPGAARLACLLSLAIDGWARRYGERVGVPPPAAHRTQMVRAQLPEWLARTADDTGQPDEEVVELVLDGFWRRADLRRPPPNWLCEDPGRYLAAEREARAAAAGKLLSLAAERERRQREEELDAAAGPPSAEQRAALAQALGVAKCEPPSSEEEGAHG